MTDRSGQLILGAPACLGQGNRRAGTSDREFQPRDQREHLGMINPSPASKSAFGDARRAGVWPPDRELVGRRGSAPADDSHAASKHLVFGRQREPLTAGTDPAGTGADHRRRIVETDLMPWRMICALRTLSPSGALATGTGWLAGPRTIITAGHFVHHRDFHGGWADLIEVSAGRNGPETPFSQFNATQFTALDRWVSDADPEFNIGCVQLDQPLGDLVGWFGVASPTASELEAARVNIGGYPTDRGKGAEQYFQANRIRRAGDRSISLDLDIVGAQSGAPVWIHRTPSAPPVVVAVQANSAGGKPFDPGMAADSAPRFIPETLDMIDRWIHEDRPVMA